MVACCIQNSNDSWTNDSWTTLKTNMVTFIMLQALMSQRYISSDAWTLPTMKRYMNNMFIYAPGIQQSLKVRWHLLLFKQHKLNRIPHINNFFLLTQRTKKICLVAVKPLIISWTDMVSTGSRKEVFQILRGKENCWYGWGKVPHRNRPRTRIAGDRHNSGTEKFMPSSIC